MSELVITGLAGVAVVACAAVAQSAQLAYERLTWLAESSVREMKRLESELEPPLRHATTKEARQEFDRKFEKARSLVGENPLLAQQAEAVARILALRSSALAAFLRPAEARQLASSTAGSDYLKNLIGVASRRFTQASTLHVLDSIRQVGSDQGFSHSQEEHRLRGRRTLVLQDHQGRALVAEVKESKDGPKVNLDLTGFGDGACHPVMDRILRGLEERQIRFEALRRRSHYRRGGWLPSLTEEDRAADERSTRPAKAKSSNDSRRRRQISHRGLRVGS